MLTWGGGDMCVASSICDLSIDGSLPKGRSIDFSGRFLNTAYLYRVTGLQSSTGRRVFLLVAGTFAAGTGVTIRPLGEGIASSPESVSYPPVSYHPIYENVGARSVRSSRSQVDGSFLYY